MREEVGMRERGRIGVVQKEELKKKSKFFLAFHPYHSKFGTVLFIHAKVFNV